MGDPLPNLSQNRAHKRNLGAVQALDKYMNELQKDKKKNMKSIDQEVLDAHKFLEHVLSNTGNSVTYEDVHPGGRDKSKMTVESTPDKYRPTKSSVMRTEVTLRKSLIEARYKVKREDFFRQWKKVFELDLELDDWFLDQQSEEADENWRYA